MLIVLNLVQSKYIKMCEQEIPSIDRGVFEFFCVPLYTHYFSDLYKKFQVAFSYDTQVEHQI